MNSLSRPSAYRCVALTRPPRVIKKSPWLPRLAILSLVLLGVALVEMLKSASPSTAIAQTASAAPATSPATQPAPAKAGYSLIGSLVVNNTTNNYYGTPPGAAPQVAVVPPVAPPVQSVTPVAPQAVPEKRPVAAANTSATKEVSPPKPQPIPAPKKPEVIVPPQPDETIVRGPSTKPADAEVLNSFAVVSGYSTLKIVAEDVPDSAVETDPKGRVLAISGKMAGEYGGTLLRQRYFKAHRNGIITIAGNVREFKLNAPEKPQVKSHFLQRYYFNDPAHSLVYFISRDGTAYQARNAKVLWGEATIDFKTDTATYALR